MNTIALSILSLLARQPLSGYDLKQQMNNRISQFIHVSNNQIYPQLKKLEVDGLVELSQVTKDGTYPEKKIYAITPTGLTQLKQASQQEFKDAVIKDGFLVKVQNSWLFSDEEFQQQIETERQRHVDKLQVFADKLAQLPTNAEPTLAQDFASRAILEYGQMYEQNYLDWLDQMTSDLPARK